MLSVQELEYVKSLINTYRLKGYKYYLCCTNSDNSINTDIYLILSKEEIKALNDTTFSITNGIQINIDTTYRYNEKNDILTLKNNIVGNVFVIDKYEYVYTNCNYTSENIIVYPDILYSSADSYKSNYFSSISLFMIVSIFLFMFVTKILRLRR